MRFYSEQGRFYGEVIMIHVQVGGRNSNGFEVFAADKTQILNGSGLYFGSLKEAKAALITWGEDMEQREADAANQDYNDNW